MTSQLILNEDNCIARDYGIIFSPEEQELLFQSLLVENWQEEIIYIMGKRIVAPRKKIFYGQEEGMGYIYSGQKAISIKFTEPILIIKKRVEEITGQEFNAAFANFYQPEDYIGWHSDNEISIKENSCIASVSFGETRRFKLRNKKDNKKEFIIPLSSGQLMTMEGETQKKWIHSVPKSKKYSNIRINITFRQMVV